MAAPDELQHLAAQLGQPRAMLGADGGGAVERGFDAAAMIMAGRLERALPGGGRGHHKPRLFLI